MTIVEKADVSLKLQTIELHKVQVGRDHEGLKLTKYGSKISIIRYQEGNNGKEYLRFCYPKTKDGAAEKFYPFGVGLGDPRQAIGILRQFVHVLEKKFSRNVEGTEQHGKDCFPDY
jgi:hypothetical protein